MKIFIWLNKVDSCNIPLGLTSFGLIEMGGGGGDIMEAVFHSRREVHRVTTPALSEQFSNSPKGFVPCFGFALSHWYDGKILSHCHIQ